MARHRLLRQRLSTPGAVLLTMFLLALSPVIAQQTSQTPIFREATRSVDGKGLDLLSTNRVLALDVNIAAFRAAAASTMQINDVPVAPGVALDLQLEEWNIIAPDAHLVFGTEHGETPMQITTRFYRGKVKGDDKSNVYLSFSDKGVIGHVRTFDKSYELSTDYTVKQQGTVVPVLAYPTDVLPNGMVKCGLTEETLHELIGPDFEKFMQSRAAVLSAASQVEFAVDGAWEGDYEYFKLFPDENAASAYMMQLIGDVSAVYERDLGAQLIIKYMKIWTSTSAEGYPYKETANMAVALRETRDYWRKHDEVVRAFVHTMSGKGWVNPIGIAFLDVLCDNGRAGSFSAITKTDAARDRRVVAHEVGHNFGSPHTHDCGWNLPGGTTGAIDHCAPAEGGTCFGTVEQSVGTIMSYCSQSNFEFHPLVQERIKARLAASGCISSARKLLIQPNRVIFGEEKLGTPHDTILDAFFTNNGFGEINVTEVSRSGVHNDEFEILEGNDLPFTLGAGESKLIKVRYKAGTTEAAVMKLIYKHNGFNPPVEVTFEGYSSDATPILGIAVENDTINWGDRFEGLPNDTTMVNMFGNFGQGGTNPATLYITDTRIEGDAKFDFTITKGSAPLQLAASERINVEIRFKPLGTGVRRAKLVIESNSGGRPGHLDSIDLVGLSRVGPVMQLGLHDLVVDFGDVPQNAVPVEKVFDGFFKNTGGSLLTYTAGVVTTVGEPGVFTSSNFGINTELPPGEDDRLNVGFNPQPNGNPAALGLKRAFLFVWSQDSLSEVDISFDTVLFVGNVIGASSVPDDLTPDEFFYATPNPTTGNDLGFYLAPRDAERGDLYILSVLDVQGREVYRRADRFGDVGQRWRIDASGWASGVYYLRVSTFEGIRGRKVTVTR